MLDAARGLGVVAVDLDVAELGVGDQDAAIDDRRADAGAQRGQQHQTGMVLGRAVVHLGDAGRVGVVDQQDVATEMILEDLLGFAVDPRLVDVRRRRVLPWVTTAGMVTPIGPSPMTSAKLATISPTTSATFFGVDLAGVVMRSRLVVNSPVARSTGLP